MVTPTVPVCKAKICSSSLLTWKPFKSKARCRQTKHRLPACSCPVKHFFALWICSKSGVSLKSIQIHYFHLFPSISIHFHLFPCWKPKICKHNLPHCMLIQMECPIFKHTLVLCCHHADHCPCPEAESAQVCTIPSRDDMPWPQISVISPGLKM